MKRLTAIVTLVAILLALVPMTTGADEGEAADLYLVLFQDTGVPAGFYDEAAALGGRVTFAHDVGVAFVTGLTADGAATLGAQGEVAAVEPDGAFQLEPVLDSSTLGAVDADPDSPSYPTTAYYYAYQWHLRAIHADQAWVAGRLGSPDVTLAVLDTGIDYMHPDLYRRVDLSRSASFVPFDDLLVAMYFPDRHPVTDLHFHGTHVAATAVSNAFGAAGVTSRTTLMGVKICNVYGSCTFSSEIQGILHAVDNGADVINLSVGGFFDKNESDGIVGFISRTLNYANAAGVTVVVSAGNNRMDLDHDGSLYKTFCSAPNTLCIAATGPTAAESATGPWIDVDAPAPYSNYGRSAIDVAAPGGTRLDNNAGLVIAACSGTSLIMPICRTGNYVGGLTGTSMAAPHVAGLAALVVEDVGRHPGQVITRIQNGADDLGQPGVDPYYGKGRIDVINTVD
jgi:subtilisin family serine protease